MCFLFLLYLLPGRAHAQPSPTIRFDPTPERGFLTAFIPSASVEALSEHETDFYWDADFALGVDVAEFGKVRGHVAFGYETVMGNELQPFDPWQGNYRIDLLGAFRAGEMEWGVLFQHVSRHLSDRRKDFGIAWNDLGLVVLRDGTAGRWAWSARALAAATVARGFVDYRGVLGGDVSLRRPLSGRLSAIGGGGAQLRLVGEEPAVSRDPQYGARLEAGLRIAGRAAGLEIVGGFERRIDADPLEYAPRSWGFLGARLVTP